MWSLQYSSCSFYHRLFSCDGISHSTPKAMLPLQVQSFISVFPSLALSPNADLRLTVTAVQPTTVTVVLHETGTTTTQFVEPGNGWEFTIPRSIIEFDGQREGRSQRSVHITSDNPVVVHATHDASWFADSWLSTISDLGYDYRMMSLWSISSPVSWSCSCNGRFNSPIDHTDCTDSLREWCGIHVWNHLEQR